MFGFLNENVLRVKGGYFEKSFLTNSAKLRILKIGVPLFKLTSCMYCIYLLSKVHGMSGYFELQKKN